jgi:WD40 repeat protein
VNDSQRFLLEHFDTIGNSPSQIYHFALTLSPASSWLSKYYATELSQEVRVVKGFPAEWGTCSRTVMLDKIPQVLVCGKDKLAVGLESIDIIILNAITGSRAAILSGHTSWVASLSFSPDGTSLVSGSEDKTLKLWDIQTGGVIMTFHGHNAGVHSVSISFDCTMIASGSNDNTIRLWNIQTGECFRVIEQQGWVQCVLFSPIIPQNLISTSGDVIQEWDINGHQVGPTHEGSHATFSPDGSHFISCKGNVAMVWDLDSREIVAKCQTPDSSPNPNIIYSCFSPSGGLVAVAAWNTVYIWDITGSDPLLIKTFIGHANNITSLTFSSPSTIISGSTDQSVKFWQIEGPSINPVANDPKPIPPTSAPIQSISLQVENGVAISSDLDGVVKMWDISTGLCKASFQTPAKDSDWRDMWMIDGRLIFVWLGERGIHIWDTEKGELLQVVNVPGASSDGLRISGDGSKVFCLIGDLLQAWSTSTGEAVGEVKLEDDSYLELLRVDGSRIWVCFKDKPAQGWDFGVPGSPPIPVPYTPPERSHLHFFYGTNWWSGDPSRIEDTVTGKQVFQLSGRYAEPTDVQWDGQYLVAGYESGEVLILDFICVACNDL